MIFGFLYRYRISIWTPLGILTMSALHELSGISKLILLVPVLVALIITMTFWERLFLRK